MLVFEARGKLNYPGVNLSKQSRANTNHRDRNGIQVALAGEGTRHSANPAPLGILRDVSCILPRSFGQRAVFGMLGSR